MPETRKQAKSEWQKNQRMAEEQRFTELQERKAEAMRISGLRSRALALHFASFIPFLTSLVTAVGIHGGMGVLLFLFAIHSVIFLMIHSLKPGPILKRYYLLALYICSWCIIFPGLTIGMAHERGLSYSFGVIGVFYPLLALPALWFAFKSLEIKNQ